MERISESIYEGLLINEVYAALKELFLHAMLKQGLAILFVRCEETL